VVRLRASTRRANGGWLCGDATDVTLATVLNNTLRTFFFQAMFRW
jgi:hypothetical protein